jgi:hypothetical protein
LSRTPFTLILTLIGLAGAALAPLGCGPSPGLQSAPLALAPGAAGPQQDQLVALADGKYPLLWQGQWKTMATPTGNHSFDRGPQALGLWSPAGDKFTTRYSLDVGGRELYSYLFDQDRYQSWSGRTGYDPLTGEALAVRYAGATLQVVAGLYQSALPDTLRRVAYDRLTLVASGKGGADAGLAKVSEQEMPPAWPLRPDQVQGAFLGPDGAWVALAGKGQVTRWNLADRLEPSLTAEQIAAQGVPLETARDAEVTLVTGPQDAPVYATCAVAGQLLVWRIPASGPAEFIGNAQSVATGEIAQLAARPDGQQWAVLLGPVPTGPATLYLTGPKFSSPQKVDLQGRAPADLAWSPTGGRLYFVLDGTEIWEIAPGQSPQLLAEGPPQMSLKPVPMK